MIARSLVLCLMTAVPLGADEKKGDLEALKGKWFVVSAEFDGGELAAKGRTVVFSNGDFTAYDGDKKGRTLKFKLDPALDPKGIDLDRGGVGGQAFGIYAVTKDELKLCYGEPGNPRPKKFESPAGDKVFLLVLKRKAD
jgi:uncharacterized protein (TIGR03067 family)